MSEDYLMLLGNQVAKNKLVDGKVKNKPFKNAIVWKIIIAFKYPYDKERFYNEYNDVVFENVEDFIDFLKEIKATNTVVNSDKNEITIESDFEFVLDGDKEKGYIGYIPKIKTKKVTRIVNKTRTKFLVYDKLDNVQTRRIDIFDETPRQILCVRSDNNVWSEGGGGDKNHELKIGQTYFAEEFDVGAWHTSIYIRELGKWFNSVLFAEITD